MLRIVQNRKHHQVDVAAGGLTPFAELSRQGLVLLGKGLGFEILQALMDQIEGVVDQLGGLFGGHGTTGDGNDAWGLGVAPL